MAHLTLEQRYVIEFNHSIGKSLSYIADQIERDKSVVSREISRNCDQRNGVYKAELANEKAADRHKNKPKYKRLTEEVKSVINTNLSLDYSPEQIVGRAALESRPMVSAETIYQYIWKDKKKGGRLYKKLRTKGKKYRKRGSLKDNRGLIVNRISIDQRPDIVDEKERIGDLEIDLVIGEEHRGALLTINDRATGMLFMGKVEKKESSIIASKTIELLADWQPLLHTITSDNGKEFASHEAIAQVLDIDYYFAKPYHSWERGANENLNGLVRQYFPKKTNFDTITIDQINTVVNSLNNRPRKRFNFKTPNEVFAQKLDEYYGVAFIT